MTDFLNDLVARREALLAELDAKPEGLAWAERHTQLIDLVVSALVPFDAPFAVIATGGYGRREVSPLSDVDLTVLPSDDAHPDLDAIVRKLYRDLNDAFRTLGLSIGYAYRLVADAPGLDAKTRTGLLDQRFIAGDPRPIRPLLEALDETFSAGDFALAKIEERRRARAATNDTPLAAEPDLKEGAGGLRDFHAANWLRAAMGERPAPPPAAYDQLLCARNLLHRVSGRPLETLTRSRQREIADRLGLSVPEMTSRLASARLELAKIYRQVEGRLSEARFPLAPGVFAARGEIRVLPSTPAGTAALGTSIGVKLGLDVGEFPAQTNSSAAGPEAVWALASGDAIRRALDRSGLLDALLPELTALRTRMPEDAVHAFSVMEHTLRAAAAIEDLCPDEFFGTLCDSLPDPGRLILAVLLHDVGKDQGDEGHAERGAEAAEAVGRRWRLAEPVIADVVWLVREHLTMARFVRMRDLERPETIEELVQIVQTPERLAMLTLLTYADVKSVAPGVLTPALITFLRQLYERALVRMEGNQASSPDIEGYRRRLVRRLTDSPETQEEIERFVASLPAHYLAGTTPELIALHRDYVYRAEYGEATVEAHQRSDLGATELTIVCPDAPGLLGKLLGVLYAYDLSILTIRASTTASAVPIALDTIVAAYGSAPIPTATLRSASDALRSVIREDISVDDVLRQRGKDPDRPQEIFRWSYVAGSPGVLEVRAPKGRGMPFRLSRRLAEHGWNILSARVGQWAGNAAAAFYISGANGEALDRAIVEAAFASSNGP